MIAVRILRHGVVIREQVVRELPVHLGRGPDNDVVLFDASVSRRHAVVETDAAGELVVRDVGSRNSVHIGPRLVSEAHGPRVVRCLLGRAEIEVERLSADDTLELRPHEEAAFEHRRTTADHVRYVALGVAAWLALAVFDSGFWSPWQQNRTGVLLGHALGALATLPLAAFTLLGILRLAGRRIRIADTLRGLAIVGLVCVAITVAIAATYYALPAGTYSALDGAAGIAFTVWAVVHLAALRRPGRGAWFRAAWGAAALVLLVGIQSVGSLAQRRMGMPQVDHHVQPPLGSFTGPRRPTGAYLDRLGAAADTAGRRAAEVHAKHSSARADRARAAAGAGN